MSGRTATRTLVLRSLADGGSTIEDLCAEIGIGRAGMRKALKGLKREGLIKEIGWERRQRGHQAIWGLGSGRPADKPKRLSSVEKTRRWKERRKGRGVFSQGRSAEVHSIDQRSTSIPQWGEDEQTGESEAA